MSNSLFRKKSIDKILQDAADGAGDGHGGKVFPTMCFRRWRPEGRDLMRGGGSYATNLQRLGLRLEATEALLNHLSGTRAGIVSIYQRHLHEAQTREAVETYDRWFKGTTLQIEEL